MTTMWEALVAKHWLLRNEEAYPAKFMFKSYYKNKEMIFNYYYYRGDSDTKYGHWSLREGRAWKEYYEQAAALAQRTKDPLDIGIADFIGWPIINNNLITNYTPKDRWALYTICYDHKYAQGVLDNIKRYKTIDSSNIEMAAVLYEKRNYWEWNWRATVYGQDIGLGWRTKKLSDTYGPTIIKKPFIRTDDKPPINKAQEAWGMWEDIYYGDDTKYKEMYDGIKTQ